MIATPTLAAIRERLAAELAPPSGRYVPLRVEGRSAGWLDPERSTRLAAMSDVFELTNDALVFVPQLDNEEKRTAALDRVARVLADEGRLTAWRDERYTVGPAYEPWFLIERAAARFFGVKTSAAHVNGVVEEGSEQRMWLARRSPAKAIDPGMLDNLVGGGIAAKQSIAQTVLKESWEEAGIPESLARCALIAAALDICREQPDGLQRETIFVHDLTLPPSFVPANRDGEAVEHRLVSLNDAATLIANREGADVVTADASLVILDFLLRHDMIAYGTSLCDDLDALRYSIDPFSIR
jgi:8-oxo-dGTP pyrophosphatase MutT (NUDIX family)